MKKIILTMLAAVAVTASFAQNNPKIDKEVKATKDFAAGEALINSKLAELSDEEKAKAYNELYKLSQPAFAKSLEALQAGKEAEVDNEAFVNSIRVAGLCSKYGSKDAAKYMEEITPVRPTLINAANNSDEPAAKLKYAVAYINSAKAGDNLLTLANFFASYASYQTEQWADAAKYAKGAFGDERVNEQAEQIYRVSLEKNIKTREDSLNYINALKELNEDKFFVQICNMYQDMGEKGLVTKMVDESLAKNPNNKFAWFIRGNNANDEKKYDEAIGHFKKVTEIDQEFVYGWYNLALSYGNKADDINLNKADKNGRLFGDDLKACSEAYNGAIASLEKVRDLDPNHENITNWPMLLRMYYNRIGKKAEADAISKMLGDM